MTQLAQPWNAGIAYDKQPWYSNPCNTCIYWPLFEGINDWKIIHLTEGGEMETLEEAKDAALGDIATRMLEHVTIGGYSAFMTTDKMS